MCIINNYRLYYQVVEPKEPKEPDPCRYSQYHTQEVSNTGHFITRQL